MNFDRLRLNSLLQSGILLSAAGFLAGLGNYAFQAIIGRQLAHDGEFGLANNTLGLAAFLGLPLAIASTAVTHYIAKFNFNGDDARLQGLLAGCRKFLFYLTIGGSALAIILVKPLCEFFNFPRPSLMLAMLVCVLAGLWSSFATALCQGLSWFKRLALIGLLAVCLRLIFCGIVVTKYPVAETAILASAFMLLANLILLFWKKDLARNAVPISPWNLEFIQFLGVAAACVAGNYFFLQGDMLVAQRYFNNVDRDAYVAAERLAVALPMTVAPLLTVLFTHRSGANHRSAHGHQIKLLIFYAIGLIFGAACLFLLKPFCLQIIGRNTPAAAAMIGPLAATMVLVGLLQALAMWALASRWMKISILYGAMGLGYWLILLKLGKSPDALLQMMPITAGSAFILLMIVWLTAMRPKIDKQPSNPV